MGEDAVVVAGSAADDDDDVTWGDVFDTVVNIVGVFDDLVA